MKSTTARRPNPRDKLKQLKERRVSSTISQQTVQTSTIVTKNASGNSKLEKQKLPHKARIRSARDGKEIRSPLQNVDFNSPTKGQIKVGSSSDASKVNEVMFLQRKTKTPKESKKDSNRSKSLLNPHQIDMSEPISSRSEVDRSKVDRLNKANLFQQKSHSNMDKSTLHKNIEHNETEKEKEKSSKENEEFDVFLKELTDATHFGTVWEHFQNLLGSTPQICEKDANVPYSEKTAEILNVACRNGANRASSTQIMNIDELNTSKIPVELFLVNEFATKKLKPKIFEKPLLSEKSDARGEEIGHANEDVENKCKDAFWKTEKPKSVCKESPVSNSLQEEPEEVASNGNVDTKPEFDSCNEPFEEQGDLGRFSHVSARITQNNCSNVDIQSSRKTVQEEDGSRRLEECTSYLPKSKEGTPEWLKLLKLNKKSISASSSQNSLEVLPSNESKETRFQHIQLKKVPKPNEDWKSPIAKSATGCMYEGVLKSERQEGGEDVKKDTSKPPLEESSNNESKETRFQHIQLKKVPKPNEDWKSPIAKSATGCMYEGVLKCERQEGGEDVKKNTSKPPLEESSNNESKETRFQHIQLKKVPKPNEDWKSPIAKSATGCMYEGVLKCERQEGGEDVKKNTSKPPLEESSNNESKETRFQHIQLKKVPKPNEDWKSPIAKSATGCMYEGVLKCERQESRDDAEKNESKQAPWSSFLLRPSTTGDFPICAEESGERACTIKNIGNLSRSGSKNRDLVLSISQESVTSNNVIARSMDTKKEHEVQVHSDDADSSTSIISLKSEENKCMDDSPELEIERYERAENYSETMKKSPNEVVSDSSVCNGGTSLRQVSRNKIDKENDGNDDVPAPKLDYEELKLIAKYREMKKRGISDETIEYDLVRKGVSDSVKIHLQNEVKANLSTPFEKNQTFNGDDCNHEKPFNPFAGGGIAAAAAMAAQKKMKMTDEASNNTNANNDQTDNVVSVSPPFNPFAGGGIAAAAAMAAQKKMKMTDEASNNTNANNDQTDIVVSVSPPFNPFAGGGIAAAAAMAAQKRVTDKNSMNKEEDTKSNRAPFNPFVGGGIAAAAALAAQKKINQGDDTQNPLSNRISEEKTVVALKNDPKFKKYFMMKKVGLDNEQIKHAMEKDGLDPAIFDGDHNKPYVPPPPAVALKDDPKFKKYFMMKKVGLDNEQIKHAMEKDGLDPAIFDGDHDKPAQTQPSIKKGQIGKKPEKPMERLPQVNITPINTSKNKVRNSLWGNEDVTIALKLDEVDMKRKFEKKRSAPQLPKVKLAVKNIEDSFSKVELIKDHTKKIKCASAYSNIKDFPTEDLIQAVNKVDSMYFKSREVVEHINTCLPADLEIAELREWKRLLASSEKSEDLLMGKLKDFEKFLIRISSVKTYREKIDALLFMLEFPSKVRNVRNNLSLIENACNEIKGSEKLRQILRFTLGCINTLNRNKVEAIVVSSLVELKNTKDGDKTMSVLEYIVNIILDQDEDLLAFIDEIPSLDLVCKFTWKDSVDQEKNDIENKVRKVRLLENECITVRGFLEEQKLHSKGTFLADLRDEICTTKDRFKKLRTDYFAEDENETSDLDWFEAFITFAKDLNVAKRKIEQQRERERMRERRIKTKNRLNAQAHGFDRNGVASSELELLLHKQRQRSE